MTGRSMVALSHFRLEPVSNLFAVTGTPVCLFSPVGRTLLSDSGTMYPSADSLSPQCTSENPGYIGDLRYISLLCQIRLTEARPKRTLAARRLGRARVVGKQIARLS